MRASDPGSPKLRSVAGGQNTRRLGGVPLNLLGWAQVVQGCKLASNHVSLDSDSNIDKI